MRRLLPLLLAVLMLPETQAQHTRRAGRHRAHGGVAAHAAVAAADTVAGDGTARVSGFDKALSARRESFFVTNDAPDSADIVWMLVTLDYTDEAGRQLHSRRACALPHPVGVHATGGHPGMGHAACVLLPAYSSAQACAGLGRAVRRAGAGGFDSAAQIIFAAGQPRCAPYPNL